IDTKDEINDTFKTGLKCINCHSLNIEVNTHVLNCLDCPSIFDIEELVYSYITFAFKKPFKKSDVYAHLGGKVSLYRIQSILKKYFNKVTPTGHFYECYETYHVRR